MITRQALLFLSAVLLSPPLSAKLPLKLRSVEGGYLLVPVMLNGAGPFEFLLDTGATATLVAPALALRLGLVLGERVPLSSVASESVARRAGVDTLSFGPRTVLDAEVLVADLGAVGRLGAQGVLGADVLFLQRFLLSHASGRLEMDFDGALAGQVAGQRLPLRRVNGRRLVEAVLPGLAHPLLLVPDSGSLLVVIFERSGTPPGEAFGRASGMLLAHTATGKAGVATHELVGLCVGGEVLKRLTALFTGGHGTLEDRVEDGLLPTSLFHDVWFDHGEGYVILNPRIMGGAVRIGIQ